MAYATLRAAGSSAGPGAMNVYSSVPSQRSTAIVSAIQLNTTER